MARASLAPRAGAEKRFFQSCNVPHPTPYRHANWQVLSCFQLGQWVARFCASPLTWALRQLMFLSDPESGFLSPRPSRKGLLCLVFCVCLSPFLSLRSSQANSEKKRHMRAIPPRQVAQYLQECRFFLLSRKHYEVSLWGTMVGIKEGGHRGEAESRKAFQPDRQRASGCSAEGLALDLPPPTLSRRGGSSWLMRGVAVRPNFKCKTEKPTLSLGSQSSSS